MGTVVLHAFNWHHADIAKDAAEIAAMGFSGVLFPPPLYSDEKGSAWWQRYQPKDYRVVRSYLGNKPELERAIQILHAHGVQAYADVVFNHMANEKETRDDPYVFPGKEQLERYRLESVDFLRDRLYGNLDHGLFSHWDFNPQGDIVDYRNPEQSTEGRLKGLPDLDLNPWVIEQQRTCLAALNGLGFDGYRVDAVKHLPAEHIRSVFQSPEAAGKFIFGEALTTCDEEENLFLWPLLRGTSVSCYDFALHETVRRAFAPGGSLRELVDPAAYGQALPWQRAVTFAVTHDIPNNGGFRGQLLNPQDEYLAKVYLLGRDGGVPLIYSDRNESADEWPCDRDRWCHAWKRADIAAMVRFHNAVHGERQRPLYEHDGFLVLARGERGIVAINKTQEWQHPKIWTFGLRHGPYRCQIHGCDMQVDGHDFTFAIPPRQAQMWLWQG